MLLRAILLSTIIIFSSCEKNNPSPTQIVGCMDSAALNYNADATIDDDSCTYPEDCNGVQNGLAALDMCGVCHESYMYAGMGAATPVATYADTVGQAGTFILAGSTSDVMNNPGWNATCAGYFFYADGYSTVSYGGQTARLDMASEMMSALASGSTTESMLDGMFDNSGDYFSNADLNASSKQIKSKTATGAENALSTAEREYVQGLFDGWFADYAANVAPIIDGTVEASPGVAGWVGNRELNAKGMEYDQIVAKSLIGALCLDQVVNSYLSPTKIGMTVDNTTRDPQEDNNATAMEHHWDEGFGYVYGKFGPNNIYGDLESDGLLGKYVNKYPQYIPVVLGAFQAGREAIIANDHAEKDAQAQIIKETLSTVVALKAISYLEGASTELAANGYSADYFHDLSEGYGFILSLQFTYNSNGLPWFTHAEVNDMLAALEAGNGLWDRTVSELDAMVLDIKTVTGL